ncbi:MAG: WbqC family protein [Spirosomaceae bacterium]|jgi:hypothetical protein|nr:WbqC family protein [Spirosomataceae bacterium]
MNKTIVTDLHFLPSLEYFSLLISSESIILEANENYIKQSYRNRCYILGANKIEPLIIPVQKDKSKMPIRDVKIDYSEQWIKIYWRTVEAAYKKAPFFEYYADYFKDILDKKPIFLWDLNFELLSICLKFLKVSLPISLTEKYEKNYVDGIIDCRNLISPKIDFKINEFYRPVSYTQNFGNDFVANLSILDLLFCKGNMSKEILAKSFKK